MRTGRDQNFIRISWVCGTVLVLGGPLVSQGAAAGQPSAPERIEVAQREDTAFSHVTGWLERAQRTYQAEIAEKLSVPRALSGAGGAKPEEALGFWGRIKSAVDTAMGYLSFWLDRAYEAVGLPAPQLPYAPDSRFERENRALAEARQEAEEEWKTLEERAEAVARDAAREAVQMATAGELPAVHLADAERARAEQRKAELAKRKQELDGLIADGLKKLEEFDEADEAGKQRIRDAARRAEEALKAAEDKLSEARKAEQARRVAEADAAVRQAQEDARRAEEARRRTEEAEKARQVAEAEAARKAEEEARRVAEAKRQADAAHKAEDERRTAEARRRTEEALKAQQVAQAQVLADAAAARRKLEEARRVAAERRATEAAERRATEAAERRATEAAERRATKAAERRSAANVAPEAAPEQKTDAAPAQTAAASADRKEEQQAPQAAAPTADTEPATPPERADPPSERHAAAEADTAAASERHAATRVAAAATDATPRRAATPRKKVRRAARSHRARASTQRAYWPRSALGCKWRKPAVTHRKRARTVKRREATLWASAPRRVSSRKSARIARSVAPSKVKEVRKRCSKRIRMSRTSGRTGT